MRLITAGVALALTALNLAAAQISAGVAKGAITPHSQVWLAGDPGRTHPGEPASGDIFARALAIDDGSGGRVLFLSVELLAVPRSLAERVAAGIMRTHGLERGQIVINASGTHNAPFVQGLHPAVSPAGAAEQSNVAEYTADVARTLLELTAVALADMQPVRLSFSSGHAAFALDTSLHGAAGTAAAADLVDTTVPVLRVTTLKGATLAVLFGYACRNADLEAGSYAISGDYSGIAAATLEREFPESVVLFLQLCDGDRRPAPRGALNQANRHGSALAAEVRRVLDSSMQPVMGRLRARLIETSLAFAPHSREQFELESKSGDAARARRAKLLLNAYDARSEPRQWPYTIQAIAFSKGFGLVALAGEPTVSYALKIRKLLGRNDLVVAGGSNDGGYIVPDTGTGSSTNADLADSIVDSGFPGAFTSEAEQRILEAVQRAWRRVGN